MSLEDRLGKERELKKGEELFDSPSERDSGLLVGTNDNKNFKRSVSKILKLGLGIGILGGLAYLGGCFDKTGSLLGLSWEYKETKWGFHCIKGDLEYDASFRGEYNYVCLYIGDIDDRIRIGDGNSSTAEIDGNADTIDYYTKSIKGDMHIKDDGTIEHVHGDFKKYSIEELQKIYDDANQKLRGVRSELEKKFGDKVNIPNAKQFNGNNQKLKYSKDEVEWKKSDGEIEIPSWHREEDHEYGLTFSRKGKIAEKIVYKTYSKGEYYAKKPMASMEFYHNPNESNNLNYLQILDYDNNDLIDKVIFTDNEKNVYYLEFEDYGKLISASHESFFEKSEQDRILKFWASKCTDYICIKRELKEQFGDLIDIPEDRK